MALTFRSPIRPFVVRRCSAIVHACAGILVCAAAARCSSRAHAPAAHDASSIDASAIDANMTDSSTVDANATDRPSDANSGFDARAGDAADDVSDADADAATKAGFCGLATQVISLGADPIAGVLEGPSRNASTTCPAAAWAPGPDDFFSLVIDAFAVVDLRVDAPVDTFIALRSGCGNDVVEVGCGDERPVPYADGGTAEAGVGSDGSADAAAGMRTARLRVALPPGRYTIVVDSFPLRGRASAPFTLSATVVPPAANGVCASPTMVEATTSGTYVELDLAGPPVAQCDGAEASTLYYAVDVPAGRQLTILGNVTGGDRPWLPELRAFDACGAMICLARGSAAAGTTQRLDWTNNGAADRLVIVAVSADGPVTGGTLDLIARTTDPLASGADGGSGQ